MDIPDVRKLQAFFKAFQESGFKPDVKAIPAHTIMRFQGKPTDILINKAEAIGLLRSHFPETFKGDEFKDDNAVVKYLSKPGNRELFKKTLTASLGDSGRQEFEEYLEFKVYKPGEEQGAAAGEGQGAQGAEQGPGTASGVAQGQSTTPNLFSSGGGSPGIRKGVSIIKIPTEATEKELVPGLKSTPETGYDYEGTRDYGPDAYRTGREAWAKEAAQKAQTEASLKKARGGFSFPKVPGSVGNLAKNFGSNLGVFFKKNVGKFLTLESGVTGFSALLGGIVGKGVGGTAGMLGGAAAGGLTPSFIKAGGGRLLGRIGNQLANVSVRLTNETTRRSFMKKKVSRRALVLLLSMFLMLIFFSAFAAPQKPQPGGTTGPGGPAGVGTTGELNCTTSMNAQGINDYFSKNGYDYFLNTGDQFVSLSSNYKISPAVIISIGRKESNLGKAYPVGSIGYNKFDAFGISPDGTNVLPFNSWMDSAQASYKAVASYNCSYLECIAGRKDTYNSEDPNWMTDVKKILASIPHSTCGISGPVAGAPGIPSGWPASGLITQTPYQAGSRTHWNANAVDIANPGNDPPVYATLDGKVNLLTQGSPPQYAGYGIYIKVTNDTTGNQAIYAHLKAYSVVDGQTVQKGDQVGVMDSTGDSSGAHVHYELVGPLGSRSTPLNNYVPGGVINTGTNVQAGGF